MLEGQQIGSVMKSLAVLILACLFILGGLAWGGWALMKWLVPFLGWRM